ncbi:MAG: hypothetical protein ACK5Z5_00910 [Neisseriaceae bacterium]
METHRLIRNDRSAVSYRTHDLNAKLNKQKNIQALEQYYPKISKIITVLCNSRSCTDLDILHFLMGKKSLEDIGFCETITHMTQSRSERLIKAIKYNRLIELDIIKEVGIFGNAHKISEEISKILCNVMKNESEGCFNISCGKESESEKILESRDKLCQLYIQTLPDNVASDFKNFTYTSSEDMTSPSDKFVYLKEKGILPIIDGSLYDNASEKFNTINYSALVKQHIRETPQKNLLGNIANMVADCIRKGGEYNHMQCNQLLGDDLTDIPQEKLDKYLLNFAEYLGISRGKISLYLEMNPITVSYDQELTKIAIQHFKDRDLGDVKEDAKLTDPTQLCACSINSEADLPFKAMKAGAITSMPGALIFGTKNCGKKYNKDNVHFGENIHAIGLRSPNTADVYPYYKRLYINIIKKVIEEGKIDHLVLNGVGDGEFCGKDDEKKKLNAKARLDAIIKCARDIAKCGMKITLPDYNVNFDITSKEGSAKLKELSSAGIDFEILVDRVNADIQGQKLADRVAGSKYVGLVNASDDYQYGCNFLTLLGDHTVEERIWNQMFFGLHYDAVVDLALQGTTMIEQNKLLNQFIVVKDAVGEKTSSLNAANDSDSQGEMVEIPLN